MNHFKCLNCGEVNEEDEMDRYTDNMGVIDPYPVNVTFLRCPNCECEDIEEFTYCEGVHENCDNAPLPGQEYCADCLKIVEEENA